MRICHPVLTFAIVLAVLYSSRLYCDAASSVKPGHGLPHTLRNCFSFGDESEVCVYKNLCWDGKEFVQLLGGTDQTESRPCDGVGDSIDWRHFELHSKAVPYHGPFGRPYNSTLPEEPTRQIFEHGGKRITCPLPRGMARSPVRSVPSRTIFSPSVAEAKVGKAKFIPKSDFKVTWSDKSTYFSVIADHWQWHPLHYGAAVLGLWAVRQSNRTSPELQGADYRYWTRGGMRFPPMDAVGVVGSYKSLGSWPRGVTKLIAPPSASLLQMPELTGNWSDKNLLCMHTAAITGQKPTGFTDMVDASAFRMRAWQAAGVETTPHPHTPPKKVLIVNRPAGKSRHMRNIKEIEALVEATGLEYEIKTDFPPDFLDQVRLVATAGVLILPHGAGAMNGIFLPAHAAMVEVFPYLMHTEMFRNIVHQSRVHHVKVFTPNKPLAKDNDAMHQANFMNSCDEGQTRLGAFTHAACNAPSKNYPFDVDLVRFRQALAEAVDAIGALPFHEVLKIPVPGDGNDEGEKGSDGDEEGGILGADN